MIASRWGEFIEAARQRIHATLKWNPDRDPVAQIAEELVASGQGAAFLKAARKGRPEKRISLRTQLVREVEKMIVVKKRKPRRKPQLEATGEIFSETPNA